MPWLHHILTHFPIALALTATALLALSRFKREQRWREAARALTFGAAAMAVAAVVTGLLSAGHVIEMGGDPARIALHRNMGLAGAALLVAAAALARWASQRDTPGPNTGAAVILALAAVVIAGAAHLAGDMLHPGLAPWSEEQHDHGPAAKGDAPPQNEHVGHDHAQSEPTRRDPETAPSASPPPSAPLASDAGTPRDAGARNHDHSGHSH